MFLTVKHTVCVNGGCLFRAVTVLNTLYKDQQAAMTSQDCPSGPPTTSYCRSWVRRLQSCNSPKKGDVETWILTFQVDSVSQGGASTTWARCAWGATLPLGSWWRSSRPTWMNAQRRSCCSSWWTALLKGCHFPWNVPVSQRSHLICIPKPRTKFCFQNCSATRTCWPLAWFSAPAVSSGSSPPWWPMVSRLYNLVIEII